MYVFVFFILIYFVIVRRWQHILKKKMRRRCITFLILREFFVYFFKSVSHKLAQAYVTNVIIFCAASTKSFTREKF